MNTQNGMYPGGHGAAGSQDAWEAYGVFRTARSLFFTLLLVGLLLVQACFWVVNVGTIDRALGRSASQWSLISFTAPVADAPPVHWTGGGLVGADQVAEALDEVVWGILGASNYVLTIVAPLYCLCLLIGLKLSLVGRLGGLAEHSRAFFLSLLVVVLVVPWQHLLRGDMFGAIFTYRQLLDAYDRVRTGAITVEWLVYYSRFLAVWVVAVIVLFAAQYRSWLAARKVRLTLTPVPVAPPPAERPTTV